MRSVTILMFILATALFLAAAFYSWQAGRNYRKAAARLDQAIADLLTKGNHSDQ